MIKNIILKPKGSYSLKKLAGFTNDKVVGKSDITINKISSIESAINSDSSGNNVLAFEYSVSIGTNPNNTTNE